MERTAHLHLTFRKQLTETSWTSTWEGVVHIGRGGGRGDPLFRLLSPTKIDVECVCWKIGRRQRLSILMDDINELFIINWGGGDQIANQLASQHPDSRLKPFVIRSIYNSDVIIIKCNQHDITVNSILWGKMDCVNRFLADRVVPAANKSAHQHMCQFKVSLNRATWHHSLS